jgi:hypothetical protein
MVNLTLDTVVLDRLYTGSVRKNMAGVVESGRKTAGTDKLNYNTCFLSCILNFPTICLIMHNAPQFIYRQKITYKSNKTEIIPAP